MATDGEEKATVHGVEWAKCGNGGYRSTCGRFYLFPRMWDNMPREAQGWCLSDHHGRDGNGVPALAVFDRRVDALRLAGTLVRGEGSKVGASPQTRTPGKGSVG